MGKSVRISEEFHEFVKAHKRENETIAHRAGQLLARADQKADDESGIDRVDPMVAAVSDVYDEPVLTDNVGDFTALGVDIEAY